MRQRIDPIGKKYGRLTVLKEVERYNQVTRQVLCRCDCGTERVFRLPKLVYNRTKSCGCFRRDFTIAKNTTHGKTQSPLYIRWRKMLERCRNPNDLRFPRYGGRGIRVCDEWQTFEGFCKDMEALFLAHVEQFGVEDTTIDRIDNNKNYEPNNCRWATHADNSRANSLAIWLEHDGKCMTTTQWAKHIGMTQGSLSKRLRNGWSVEKALTTPPKTARVRQA